MRKIAVRKAAAMIRCMPAAVVMVDNNMNIIEANDSFMRMFTGDKYNAFNAQPDRMNGVAIGEILSFSELFKMCLNSGKDLHKEHYAVKEHLYDINIFTL